MAREAVYSNEWDRARGETSTAPSEHEHDQMSVPTAIPFRRDAAAPVGVMSPRAESVTDVSRLKAQAGTIAAIVVAAIGIVLYVERGFSEIKSEIRQINTLITLGRENTDLKMQLMKSDIEKSELRKALLAELKPQ